MTVTAARTYNQTQISRPLTPGRRRMSIYWTWSYPWEAQRDPAGLYNRFSTMTEVRTVLWPIYETPEWDENNFLQGIDGTLELFHRSTLNFQKLAGEVTGYPVAIYQRQDQAGFRQRIDDSILDDTDTLMVFGLDHLVAGERAESAEIEAIKKWLKREGTCLLLAPHHDVGFVEDHKQQQMEYLHHGDLLVPRQQRFTGFTRSLMEGLGTPVHNKWGLCPARVDGQIVALNALRENDARGLLKDVDTLSFHRHLPHYELLPGAEDSVKVLARQPIDMDRPHPFTLDGNTEFNCMLWMQPQGERAGDIVFVDSTHFTTLFGVSDSLKNFWRNLASM